MSYVYVARGKEPGLVKIGMSATPEMRMSAIGRGVTLVHTVLCGAYAADVEKASHAALISHRMEGEWFKLAEDVAIAMVERVASEVIAGRPVQPEPCLDTQIAVRMGKPTFDILDDVRREERDVPTRAEMIRRLIQRAGEQKAREKRI